MSATKHYTNYAWMPAGDHRASSQIGPQSFSLGHLLVIGPMKAQTGRKKNVACRLFTCEQLQCKGNKSLCLAFFFLKCSMFLFWRKNALCFVLVTRMAHPKVDATGTSMIAVPSRNHTSQEPQKSARSHSPWICMLPCNQIDGSNVKHQDFQVLDDIYTGWQDSNSKRQ